MLFRTSFLATAAVACDLLSTPDVANHWDEPSALPEMTVGDLAGHLARGIITVEAYLDGSPSPQDTDTDAVGYVLGFAGLNDPQSDLNEGIRKRSRDVASVGHAALVAAVTSVLAALQERLPNEPDDRTVQVMRGTVMRLDDYLVTRMLELTVHIDDLSASLGAEPPHIDETPYRITIATLIDIARRSRGDVEVLRALTRRERAADDVFPVL